MVILQFDPNSLIAKLKRAVDEHSEKAAYLFFDHERLINQSSWGTLKRGRL